jgi:hypothetical protein
VETTAIGQLEKQIGAVVGSPARDIHVLVQQRSQPAEDEYAPTRPMYSMNLSDDL